MLNISERRKTLKAFNEDLFFVLLTGMISVFQKGFQKYLVFLNFPQKFRKYTINSESTPMFYCENVSKFTGLAPKHNKVYNKVFV